jgi:O-antigen ligase
MNKEGRIFRISDSLEEKIFLFLIGCVVLTMPLKPATNWIISLVLVLFWLMFQKKNLSFESLRSRTSLLLTIFFILSLIALLYTENLEVGLSKLQNRSLLILFPVIFGTVKTDVKKTERAVTEIFILTFFLAGIVCEVVAFNAYRQDGSLTHFSGHPLVEWMMYPYVFVMNCMVAIIFLFEKLGDNSNSGRLFQSRKVILIFIAFFTTFIFLVSIKLVIINWLVITLMYGYRLTNSKRHFFGLMLAISVLTACAVLLVPALRLKATEVLNTKENTIPLDVDASLGRTWNGIALRKAIWTCSLDVIKQNFWIGTGPGDTQDKLQEAYEARKFYFASRYNTYHAHNQYLQTLLNFGVIGLVVFFITHFVILIFRMRHSFVFVTFTLSILMMFWTESMLEVNKGILLYAFFSSFIVFITLSDRQKV